MSVNNRLATKILLFSSNDVQVIDHDTDGEDCDTICWRFCKQLGIIPLLWHLFGLREQKTKNTDPDVWVPPCRSLRPNVDYEFRLRYKVDCMNVLMSNCVEAYNYFYFQVRHDVLNNQITELNSSKFANDILGLCITDMYREIIMCNDEEKEEKKTYLKKNYGNYIPRELKKKYPVFLKSKIVRKVDVTLNNSYKPSHLQNAYIEKLQKLAPNYQTETYEVKTLCLESETSANYNMEMSARIRVQDGKLRTSYQEEVWNDLPLDELCEIKTREDEPCKTKLFIQLKNTPVPLWYKFNTPAEMESFASCVVGYFRFSCSWTTNLFKKLPLPSLDKLKESKCHGPVGGIFARQKLERAGNRPGQFVLRECERDFDRFFIEIVRKCSYPGSEEGEPESFAIRRDGNCFILFKEDGETEKFESLLALAQGISLDPDGKKHERVAPSEYDKPPLLLLCLPQQQSTKAEIQKVSDLAGISGAVTQPRLITNDHLVIGRMEYKSGPLTVHKGEWLLPNNKKIHVTVKRISPTIGYQALLECSVGIMELANRWCNIDCHAIARLYCVTFGWPNRCLVFEDMPLGPLDTYLRNVRSVPMLALVDAARSLAIAVQYMQEHNIVHGRIRCSNIHVKAQPSFNSLETKLGDPGLDKPFNDLDIPFIPIEHLIRNDINEAKRDIKADLWAFATTMYEIFTRGSITILSQEKVECIKSGKQILDIPEELKSIDDHEVHEAIAIYEIMKEGWSSDPDQRFFFQSILSRLYSFQNKLDSNYTEYIPSNGSGITDITHLTNNGHTKTSQLEISLGSNGMDSLSIDYELERKSCSFSTALRNDDSDIEDRDGEVYLNGQLRDIDQNTALFLINRKIENGSRSYVYEKLLGEGNFGSVYEGRMEDHENHQRTSVALKVLQMAGNDRDQKDIRREAAIMKKLNHPNIVRILDVVNDNPFIIVMELMSKGELLIYLQTSKSTLTSNRLLKFAQDVASAMEYLEKMKVIHRDLAARNILVESHDSVKISDFGLAQPSEKGYYRQETLTRHIPIKWYAPETYMNERGEVFVKFSHASDVWSFGVLLWEMFSCGKKPYGNEQWRSEDLYFFLKGGNRLERPIKCPDVVYEQLMYPCWAFNHHERPNFKELLQRINEMLEDYKQVLEFNTSYW